MPVQSLPTGIDLYYDVHGEGEPLVFIAASGSGLVSRPGEDCVPGLPYFLVDEWVRLGFEEFVRHEICDSSTYFTPEFRAEHPERVRAFFDLVWRTHARWPEYLRLCMARHTWEATHRLGEVAMPTLVVIGDQDIIGSNHVPQ